MNTLQSFDRLVLPNGLTIVGERIPHFKSVAVGVWVRTGSADEAPLRQGYSHFVEHMVFKGAGERNLKQLAEEMDLIGGQMNAFTSKECTCFYAKVMDEHLDRALSLLADLTMRPHFPAGELEKEKGVVLEEIAMGEDMPEDMVHEQLALALFGDHPLGGSILGPKENIEAANRESLLAFLRQRYLPGNAVLSVAGHYDWPVLTEKVRRAFEGWQGAYVHSLYPPVSYRSSRLFRRKDTEQTHVCLGFPSLAMDEEGSFSLAVLNNLLGGSMSSRLFQSIREDAGLAYNVYSYASAYVGAGDLVLYAGTNPRSAQEVSDRMAGEVKRLLRQGVPAEEFEKSREQIKGVYVLGMEATTARMNAMGKGQLLTGKLRSQEDYLQRLKAASREEAMALAERIFRTPPAASVVGPENIRFDAWEEI